MRCFAEVLSQHSLWLPESRQEAKLSSNAAQRGWVRAASGLAWYGQRIGLVQDDTMAIVWLDPFGQVLAQQSLEVDGRAPQHFDVSLGNKHLKPDLEAAVSFYFGGNEYWLALGSGSSAQRERGVLLCSGASNTAPRWLNLQQWYELLRACRDFAGAGLNIEAAFVLGQGFYLVQRGNGRTPGAINAIAEFALAEVCAFLCGSSTNPPEIKKVHACALGTVAGVAWGFADACVIGSRIWFLLSAEDSPDTIADGAVVGSALAFCDDAEFVNLRMGRICYADGREVLLKLEGLCVLSEDQLLAVSDADDPTLSAQCLRLKLIT